MVQILEDNSNICSKWVKKSCYIYLEKEPFKYEDAARFDYFDYCYLKRRMRLKPRFIGFEYILEA